MEHLETEGNPEYPYIIMYYDGFSKYYILEHKNKTLFTHDDMKEICSYTGFA